MLGQSAEDILNVIDGGQEIPDMESAPGSPEVDKVSAVDCTDTADDSAVQCGPSTSGATKGVFHKRKTNGPETPAQQQKRERACLQARRKRRKAALTKEVTQLQLDLQHPHGCNQKVFLLVEDNESGKSWCAGSAEWVANYKANLPIAHYIAPPAQENGLTNTITFGYNGGALPVVPESPPRPRSIREAQLADL